MLFLSFSLIMSLGEALKGDKVAPGHLLPLGSHAVPEEADILRRLPSAHEFYNEYVRPGRPVIFQDILLNGNFPVLSRWNDSYLGEKYERYVINIEHGKKEKPVPEYSYMRMSQFLQEYRADDIYMVQNLHSAMKDDVSVPPFLQCGGFQNSIMTVRLWMSSGNTVSSLHYQEDEHLYCQTDGGTSWVLISPNQEKLVKGRDWDNLQRKSRVDSDSVDMSTYPGIRYVQWVDAILSRGDCLYIPKKWFVQSRSPAGRTQAIDFSFYHLPWFNTSHCAGVWPKDWVTLSQYKYMSEIEQKRYKWLQYFEGKDSVDIKDVEKLKTKFKKDEWAQLIQFFRLTDTNRDMTLTWNELLNFDMHFARSKLKALFKDDEEDGDHTSSDEKYTANVKLKDSAEALYDAVRKSRHEEL